MSDDLKLSEALVAAARAFLGVMDGTRLGIEDTASTTAPTPPEEEPVPEITPEDIGPLPTWESLIGYNVHDKRARAKVWRANEYTDTLSVPFGYRCVGKNAVPTTDVFNLDIAELSRNGTGPHGCIQGKTGSGKSDTIDRYVTSAAALYSPTKLRFLFAPVTRLDEHSMLAALPHVEVTGEVSVDAYTRFGYVVEGEISCREKLLFKHKCKDIHTYRELMSADDSTEPLPFLVVVVSDSHEFFVANRVFTEPIARVGAKGRSLGIHLMLSDQFIDSSLHHNLMNHMTYGVSFRSISAAYSRTVLDGDPGAALLPVGKGDALVRSVDPDGGGSVIDRVCALSVDTEVLVEAIDAIAGSSKRERPQALWTPTLHAPVSFADIDEIDLPPRTVQIGVLDDPFHHTRNPFTVSLDGNTVVCGSSGAGKTTTISSIVTAALRARSGDQFYIIDSRGSLGHLKDFSNVGGYVQGNDQDRVNRVIEEFTAAARGDGDDSRGNMTLVIDDAPDLILREEGLKSELFNVALGVKNGASLLVSVPSVSSLPVKLQGGLFVNVIALRVDDTSTMGPIDMKIKQRMKQIPSQPGRGTDIKSGLDMRVAYPSDIPFTDDGTPAVDDFSDIAEYGAKLSKGAPKAHRIEFAEDVLQYNKLWNHVRDHDTVSTASKFGRLLPLGVDVSSLRPHSLYKSPHFVVTGDARSGKTSALRTVIESVTRQYAPDEAKFIVLDPSFSLMSDVESLVSRGYMKDANYAVTRDESREPMEMLKTIITKRTPRKDTGLSARDLVDRTWFDGPEIFVIVDDYHRLRSQPGNSSPIDELAAFLGNFDVGVHLIVAAPSSGFSQMLLSNKLFRAIEESGSPILLLSGNPSEGRVTALRARFEARRPGRGQYILPATVESHVIQVAYVDPPGGSL